MASEVLHEAQPKSSVGRRAFLMGSAAALGVVAATGFGCKPDEHLDPEPAPAPEPTPAPAPEEKEFVGSCRGNCFGGCKIKVKVREGKVVSIDHKNGLVVVEGIIMLTKHNKSNPQNPNGGIIHVEARLISPTLWF